MRKIIVLALLFTMANPAFSQKITNTPPAINTGYLKKSEKQKTAAWILLGGGVVCAATGYVIIVKSAPGLFASVFTGSKPSGAVTTGAILLYTGLASICTSIPLFIVSSKNNKRAMSLSFKNEIAPQMRNSSFNYKPIPSISFKFNL